MPFLTPIFPHRITKSREVVPFLATGATPEPGVRSCQKSVAFDPPAAFRKPHRLRSIEERAHA